MYTGKREDLRPYTRIVLFVLTVSGIASLPRADAETIGTALDEATAAADAVIHGTVVDVDYRSSTDGAGALPHAFVTYEVGEVLAGQVASRRLTLRFVGGPDKRGHIFQLAHVPMFDVGNEDVLFIRGNGRSGCPLVGCENGRLRIHENRLYGADGTPMVGVQDGRLAYRGRPRTDLLRVRLPVPHFDDLIEDPEIAAVAKSMLATMSLDEMRRRYEQEAPAYIEFSTVTSDQGSERDYGRVSTGQAASAADKTTGVSGSLAVSDLLASLRSAARTAPAVGKPPVKSVDPDRSFTAGAFSDRR
jgi:hypothetical protein